MSDSPRWSAAHPTLSLPAPSQVAKGPSLGVRITPYVRPTPTKPKTCTGKASLQGEPHWVRELRNIMGFPQTLLNTKVRHKTHKLKMSSQELN